MSTVAAHHSIQAPSITLDDARYALGLVETICAQVGPGMPGTPQERARAVVIRDALISHLGADRVAVEEFSLAPGACLGAMPISAASILVAALLNLATPRVSGIAAWATSIGALACSLIAVGLFVSEFVLGLEVIDPLFPKRRSCNVIGTLRRPGARPVKRVLIVGGHHDSAPENTWLGLLGYGSLVLSTAALAGFAVMVVTSAIQLTGILVGDAGIVRAGTLGWILSTFFVVPSVVNGMFFNRGRKGGGTVPGAADNLAASALTVALCRFLVRHPAEIPADTEIRFVSFGSEEAGLRGSRRYVARHLRQLRALHARLLNFETVAHPEIGILTSDTHGTVKSAPAMVRSAVAAAKRAGVPYKVKRAYFGVSTDAGSFSRAGLEATSLLPFKVPQQLVAFYHQPSDRPEVLSVDALLNVLKIAVEWIRGGEESGARS